MKIFLDTANLESIRKFNDMGLLDGITTNPSLMSKEGGNPKDAMKEIQKSLKVMLVWKLSVQNILE